MIAASLNVLGQQAAALASFPVPSCADPRGIFAALLSQIVSVTGEVGPDATLADLQQAINQLGSVFSLEERLHRRSEADHWNLASQPAPHGLEDLARA